MTNTPDIPIGSFQQSIAWRTGWNAARYNKTWHQNPWTRPDLRAEWEAGWTEWHNAQARSFGERTASDTDQDL